MTDAVDLRTCSCGYEHHVDDAPFVGVQALGGGDVVLLHNCPSCRTTFAGPRLTDAAVCCQCKHGIVGDAEDPKVISDEGIRCLDCHIALHVPRIPPIVRMRRNP